MSSTLALAVLATLAERALHPYEMAQVLRSRGKDTSIKINYGSLYTVVQSLEKHGFIEAAGVERDGRRPERTTYRITPAGTAEMREWLAELLSVRVHEFPRFEAALSLAGILSPDEVESLLRKRVADIDAQVAKSRRQLDELGGHLPALFLIEHEYELAMARAEADWTRGLLASMADETLTGMAAWRQFHATGEMPTEWIGVDTAARTTQEGRSSTAPPTKPE